MIELLRFRLQPGTDEEAFLRADKQVQEEFAYQQPGLLRRTTARGKDGWWIVVDRWRSATDADAADIRREKDTATQMLMSFVDAESVSSERWEELPG
jgi:uncharacterized protein (DUF2237 family)